MVKRDIKPNEDRVAQGCNIFGLEMVLKKGGVSIMLYINKSVAKHATWNPPWLLLNTRQNL